MKQHNKSHRALKFWKSECAVICQQLAPFLRPIPRRNKVRAFTHHKGAGQREESGCVDGVL